MPKSKFATRGRTSPPSRNCERWLLHFRLKWRVNILAAFESELFDSDELENSRKADEKSELGSVQKDSIDNFEVCQTVVADMGA
ncbi:MAG: hypothetical protein DMF61_20535 [Blastocatellia bacterium AA13]|nr:MAG: hypothetical protein DMF61_20535 [Blastocatellia bacterium AA13]